MLQRFSLVSLMVVCLAASAPADPATVLAHLSNTGLAAVKVDATGNIYIAGYLGTPNALSTYDAFVAKLSPDGSHTLYTTRLGGSQYDQVFSLAVDAAGAAYVLGLTASADFPVTPGAIQSTFASGLTQAFVTKVDPLGHVVYSTLIGGTSNVFMNPGSLVVDHAGEAILSASSDPDSFPAATTPATLFTGTTPNFILKLDSAGRKVLAAIRGMGGLLALDSQDSVYVAGTEEASTIPITPGAFQPTAPELPLCGGTIGAPGLCPGQYVTKLDASLSRIVYSTFLTASFGAAPASLEVDAQGNAWLAGTTNSPTYPTTSDAFEPNYVANAPPDLNQAFPPPPTTGYVTQLNSTGTALLYSTFFGGAQSDTITFAALTGQGIYLSGLAGSSDLPALEGVPSPCLPETFETRLSLDGSSITATRIVAGQVLAYNPSTGKLLAWTGSDLLSFDPAAPPNHIACILDAADWQPATSVVPGELLTLFGSHFTEETVGQFSGGYPTSIAGLGLTITVNGIPSPLMYVSPQQVNLQVPYEIASASQAALVVTSSEENFSESQSWPVIPRNPVAFLTHTALSQLCQAELTGFHLGAPLPLFPVALNSDGSQNSCTNPAAPGSIVRIFLDGLGITSPAPLTGSINASPGVPLNLPIAELSGSGITVASAAAAVGSISGVWQLDLRIPSGAFGATPVLLSVDSVPSRDSLAIWVSSGT